MASEPDTALSLKNLTPPRSISISKCVTMVSNAVLLVFLSPVEEA